MSIRAMPMLILALILYVAIVLFSDGPPHEIFQTSLTGDGIWMPLGGRWVFTLGDLVLTIALILLAVEVVKATYTRGSGLADQALSIVLFVVFIVLFLLWDKAATSEFFLITLMSLLDIIAGAIIGIRTARRDFGIGSDIG